MKSQRADSGPDDRPGVRTRSRPGRKANKALASLAVFLLPEPSHNPEVTTAFTSVTHTHTVQTLVLRDFWSSYISHGTGSTIVHLSSHLQMYLHLFFLWFFFYVMGLFFLYVLPLSACVTSSACDTMLRYIGKKAVKIRDLVPVTAG